MKLNSLFVRAWVLSCVLPLALVMFASQATSRAQDLDLLLQDQLGGVGGVPGGDGEVCLLYTSPSPRDATLSRMPSSA